MSYTNYRGKVIPTLLSLLAFFYIPGSRAFTPYATKCGRFSQSDCPPGYQHQLVAYSFLIQDVGGHVDVEIDRDLTRPNEVTYAKSVNAYKAFKNAGTTLLMVGKDSHVFRHEDHDKKIYPLDFCATTKGVRNIFAEFFLDSNKYADFDQKIELSGDVTTFSSELCTTDTGQAPLMNKAHGIKTIQIKYRTAAGSNDFEVKNLCLEICTED